MLGELLPREIGLEVDNIGSVEGESLGYVNSGLSIGKMHLCFSHEPCVFACDLISSQVDEEHGRRGYASWIAKLKADVEHYLQRSSPMDFSSSKHFEYNNSRKKCAEEIIFPRYFREQLLSLIDCC